MFNYPTICDFTNYFSRDFMFTPDGDNSGVTDCDIQKAQNEALINFNTELFSDQNTFTICYQYLTAHCLVTNIANSSQGLSGQYNWLISGKGIASVSGSYAIPQRILDNPELAAISKTTYGARYISMILPLLTGQMFTVFGQTKS